MNSEGGEQLSAAWPSPASQSDVETLTDELKERVLGLLENAHAVSGTVVFDPDESISSFRIAEVAERAIRDLRHIEEDHLGGILITKYLGYIGYWFAHLKPVSNVRVLRQIDGESVAEDILGINEQLSVLLLSQFLWSITFAQPAYSPPFWKNCSKNCAHQYNGTAVRGRCLGEKLDQFLSLNNGTYMDYLLHTLRGRNSGPELLVNWLNVALAFSCEDVIRPIFI